ncbi:MAG: hypothetical protein IKX21_07970, partial [Deltaproteobacteria bacterium]|nr:hypothetical protein [Deltaproteobacteria bacterium]
MPHRHSNGEKTDFYGMLSYDGTLTKVYDRVRQNNERFESMGYRFLSYKLKGFLTDGLKKEGYADA